MTVDACRAVAAHLRARALAAGHEPAVADRLACAGLLEIMRAAAERQRARRATTAASRERLADLAARRLVTPADRTPAVTGPPDRRRARPPRRHCPPRRRMRAADLDGEDPPAHARVLIGGAA